MAAFDPDIRAYLVRIGGERLVERLVRLFVEGTERRLRVAAEGVGEGDLTKAGRALRQLKDSARLLGVQPLYELAASAESLATPPASPRLAETLERMERAFAVLRPRLEGSIDAARAPAASGTGLVAAP